MAEIFRLAELNSLTSAHFEHAIKAAPNVTSLKDAAAEVIRSLHGMPEHVGCDLSQLQVYLGRAGATASHVANRWRARFADPLFADTPENDTTHALVAFRAPTTQVREGRWETTGQRILNALGMSKALCCANAKLHDGGAWPDTASTAIYLVAKKAPRVRVSSVDSSRLHEATSHLLNDDNLEDAVVRVVGKLIPKTEDAHQHNLVYPKASPNRKPITEAELRATLNEPASPSSTSGAQIYRSLKRLLPRGLVEDQTANGAPVLRSPDLSDLFVLKTYVHADWIDVRMRCSRARSVDAKCRNHGMTDQNAANWLHAVRFDDEGSLEQFSCAFIREWGPYIR